MIPTWEQPGSPVFRRVFVGSLAFTGSVVLFTLLASVVPLWRVPDILSYLLLGGGMAVLWPAINKLVERRADFLESPAGMTAGEGLLSVVVWGILLYVVLGLVVGGIAFTLVSRDDHHWPMVVMGLATYVPLMLIGPPAAVIAWKRARRAAQQADAADEVRVG